jgi:hypothetical protein
VHDSVVADAGALLVFGHILGGIAHDVDQILALDSTSLLLAEYFALRHDGAADRARVELASVVQIVREWFPVRGVAIEAALAASAPDDINGTAALKLAEALGTPLVTRNGDLRSDRVPVLRC